MLLWIMFFFAFIGALLGLYTIVMATVGSLIMIALFIIFVCQFIRGLVNDFSDHLTMRKEASQC